MTQICTFYDSAVQPFKIDFKRALYRKERRQILSEIIKKKKSGLAIDRYIKSQAKKLIRASDQAVFVADSHEDLQSLNSIRIAGLGVTPEEFRDWKRHLLK